MRVDFLDLTVRARGVLEKLGILHLKDLAELDPVSLGSISNAGSTTLKELARACLMRNLVPLWLPVAAKKLKYAEPETTLPEGATRLAGPYTTEQVWMLERAIAQLMRDGIKWSVGTVNGEWELYRQGGRPIEPLPEDEWADAERDSLRFRACPVYEQENAAATAQQLIKHIKRL